MKKLLLSTLLLLAAATSVLAETVQVTVKGMVCSFCAQGLDKKFRAEPAVEDVKVSLKEKTIRLQLKDGATLSNDAITKIVLDAGYNVQAIDRK
jgi:mercuric ion binding protein